MTDLLFADTNILVYAMDPAEPAKRASARIFLTSAAAKGVLVTSPQTITECYRVLAERRRLLDHQTARRFLATFEWTCIAPLDWETIRLGWKIGDAYNYGWWDSLMLATALRAACAVFVTEGLQSGIAVEGMLIMNPFTDDLSAYLD
jgi:predicted nucleic acid-binding protein